MLIQSPETDLSGMLARHKDDVFEWISERADEHSEDEEEEKEEEGGEGEKNMRGDKDEEMKD